MQIPEGVLPFELRMRVQSFLRTPTAEIIHAAIEPWQDCKAHAMLNCILETGDPEVLARLEEWMDRTFTFQGVMLTGRRLNVWTRDVVEDEPEVETDTLIAVNLGS